MTAEALPVDSRRGMILVIVLWSVALMTVVVVALSSLVQTGLSSAGLDADRLRSRMALEAGVEIGMAMVLARRAGERAYFEGTPVVTDIGHLVKSTSAIFLKATGQVVSKKSS